MEITNASALVIRPGDRVALMFPETLSHGQRDEAMGAWKTVFPNTPCLIFDGGTSIAVLGDEQVE
jgi:hypothetical protein